MAFWRKKKDEAADSPDWVGQPLDDLVVTAGQLIDAGRTDEAEPILRHILDQDDTRAYSWFDLGLLHKWRREWPEALECNRRSLALHSGEQDPAFWNAGIAATALEDWETARWAWRGFGIPIPDGEGEIEEDLGLGVVRLPEGETVWGRRLDPARMRLLSIPLADSGFRCGDVVLHDGAPNGKRVWNGYEYSVFDVISRMRPSSRPTIELLVDATAADLQELSDRIVAAPQGFTTENWTESVHVLCKACSEGRLDYDHPDHGHGPVLGDDPVGYSRLAVSGDPETVAVIAEAWQAETDGVLQQTVVHTD